MPAFWLIRQQCPDAKLTLLSETPDKQTYISPRQILPPKGLIDDYVNYRTSTKGRSPRDLISFLAGIRKRKYDLLIYLAPRARNNPWRMQRDLVLFRLAGIKNVIGHRGVSLLSKRVKGHKLPEVISEADSLIARLEFAGFSIADSGMLRRDLALTEMEENRNSDYTN